MTSIGGAVVVIIAGSLLFSHCGGEGMVPLMLAGHGGNTTVGGPETILEFKRLQQANGQKYLDAATDPENRQRHAASLAHDDAVIRLLQD